MPSAGRPFTPELVTELVTRGVLVAPVTLHTGVSSPERGEPPFPERFQVPSATARLVNAVRAWNGRVIAVGTTVVRALETVAAADGTVSEGRGWTSLVVTPERGLLAIDGLLTGWHEPESSHLQLLEAAAGLELLGSFLPGSARARLPLARVRRPAPDPALTLCRCARASQEWSRSRCVLTTMDRTQEEAKVNTETQERTALADELLKRIGQTVGENARSRPCSVIPWNAGASR